MGIDRSLPSIPPVPTGVSEEVSQWMDKISEALEIRAGQRGDELDKAITLRDLVDGGLVKYRDSSGDLPIRDLYEPPFLTPVDTGYDPYTDLSPATPPTNVTVTATPTYNFIDWDPPGQAKVAHAEIWKGTDPNSPETAVLVGTSFSLYADPSDPYDDTTYYYYVRFRNLAETAVYSAWHDLAGTEAPGATIPAADLIEALQGELDESTFAQSLNARIDLIDAPTSGLVDRLTVESQVRHDAVAVLQSQVDGLVVATDLQIYYQDEEPTGPQTEGSRWFDTNDENHPYIYLNGVWNDARDGLVLELDTDLDTETLNRITADAAQVAQISALNALVFDPDSGTAANTSAIASLDSRVTFNEDGLVAQSLDITALETNLAVAEGQILSNTNAATTLTTRVTNNEAGLSSQASDITLLQTGLTSVEEETSFNAGALSSLDVRVSDTEGVVSAQASEITQLQVTTDSQTASLVTLANVVAGPGGLEAQFVVKTDVNGNLASFGLYNSSAGDSRMLFAVDEFAIVKPGTTDLSFFVQDGRVVMPGASIQSASITNAQIANAAIDSAKIVNGSIINAKLGNASVTNAKIGGAIYSNNYSGSVGWYISKDGNAIFRNAFVRGNVTATSIDANSVNIIDTLMLRGQAVTFSSGYNIGDGSLNPDYKFVFSTTYNASGGRIQCSLVVEGRSPNDGQVQAAIVINGSYKRTGTFYVRADDGSDASWNIPGIVQYVTGGTSGNVNIQVAIKRSSGRSGSYHNAYLTITELKR